MQGYVLRRLLLAVVTLLITSFLVFTMLRRDPDAVVAARLGGEGYTQDQVEQVKEQYGLNKPLPTEYLRWVSRVVRGDWGESAYTYKPVLNEMGPKIAVTLELALRAHYLLQRD